VYDGNPFRITVDQDICIGSGTCVASAPLVFRIDDSGRARVIDQSQLSLELASEIASDCPSEAIGVVGPDGATIGSS
jgi:ferredoxin